MDRRKAIPGQAPWAAIMTAAGLAAALAGCGSGGTGTAGRTPAAALSKSATAHPRSATAHPRSSVPASAVSSAGGTAPGGASATSAPPSVTSAVSTSPVADASLPISVQSDSAMHAAANAGPSSSILIPASCRTSGNSVTAAGTYQGGFVPAVYGRYGDVINLYVFTKPASGYSGGFQLGELSRARFPGLGGARTWTVTVPLDTSLGRPRRCLVAAQPTHDFEGAPSAY